MLLRNKNKRSMQLPLEGWSGCQVSGMIFTPVMSLTATTLPQCWSGLSNDVGQWIQVSGEFPKKWIGVIIQGRGDLEGGNQWVKPIKLSSTVNGKTGTTLRTGRSSRPTTIWTSKWELTLASQFMLVHWGSIPKVGTGICRWDSKQSTLMKNETNAD